MSYRAPRFVLVIPVLLLTATIASAGELRSFEHHVRTTDVYLRALIRHGVDTSPAFNALVDQLTRTDVIVYLVRSQFMKPYLDGELSFLVKTGDVRYVKIQLAWDRHAQRQLATIAHELQHALEIAESPSIVDEATMAFEYGRMLGFEKSAYNGRRRFESQAAIDAGRQVWKEYVFED